MLDIYGFGKDWASNKPFIICEQNSKEIAKSLRIKTLSYGWKKHNPGSIDHYIDKSKKIAICIECG